MKLILSFFLCSLCVLSQAQPAFAYHPEGWRPFWSRDAQKVTEESCKLVAGAQSVGTQTWEFLYRCPNGDSFWSEVLVPFNPTLLTPPFSSNGKPSPDPD